MAGSHHAHTRRTLMLLLLWMMLRLWVMRMMLVWMIVIVIMMIVVLRMRVYIPHFKNQLMQSKVVEGYHSQPHQVLRTYAVIRPLPAEEDPPQEDVLS